MYFLLKLLAFCPVLLCQPFPGPYVSNSRQFGMGVFSGLGLMESKFYLSVALPEMGECVANSVQFLESIRDLSLSNLQQEIQGLLENLNGCFQGLKEEQSLQQQILDCFTKDNIENKLFQAVLFNHEIFKNMLEGREMLKKEKYFDAGQNFGKIMQYFLDCNGGPIQFQQNLQMDLNKSELLQDQKMDSKKLLGSYQEKGKEFFGKEKFEQKEDKSFEQGFQGKQKKGFVSGQKIIEEEQKPKFPLPTIDDQQSGAKHLESTETTSEKPFSCGKNQICPPSGEYSPYMDQPTYQKRGCACETCGELGHGAEEHKFGAEEFQHEHHHGQFAHEHHHAYHPGKPGFEEKPFQEVVPQVGKQKVKYTIPEIGKQFPKQKVKVFEGQKEEIKRETTVPIQRKKKVVEVEEVPEVEKRIPEKKVIKEEEQPEEKGKKMKIVGEIPEVGQQFPPKKLKEEDIIKEVPEVGQQYPPKSVKSEEIIGEIPTVGKQYPPKSIEKEKLVDKIPAVGRQFPSEEEKRIPEEYIPKVKILPEEKKKKEKVQEEEFPNPTRRHHRRTIIKEKVIEEIPKTGKQFPSEKEKKDDVIYHIPETGKQFPSGSLGKEEKIHHVSKEGRQFPSTTEKEEIIHRVPESGKQFPFKSHEKEDIIKRIPEAGKVIPSLEQQKKLREKIKKESVDIPSADETLRKQQEPLPSTHKTIRKEKIVTRIPEAGKRHPDEELPIRKQMQQKEGVVKEEEVTKDIPIPGTRLPGEEEEVKGKIKGKTEEAKEYIKGKGEEAMEKAKRAKEEIRRRITPRVDVSPDEPNVIIGKIPTIGSQFPTEEEKHIWLLQDIPQVGSQFPNYQVLYQRFEEKYPISSKKCREDFDNLIQVTDVYLDKKPEKGQSVNVRIIGNMQEEEDLQELRITYLLNGKILYNRSIPQKLYFSKYQECNLSFKFWVPRVAPSGKYQMEIQVVNKDNNVVKCLFVQFDL